MNTSNQTCKFVTPTFRIEGRNENIKMKERDIQDIKKKVEAAQPQKRYKYIIPFGHPHLEDSKLFLS